MKQNNIRIGIDIGGTFTDFVLFYPDQSSIQTFKILSTPEDPARAVLEGLKQLGILGSTTPKAINCIHGSTVATNALLERKGAATALVTTQGFADVLQIGRQNRPELYNLHSKPPEPLIPSELRLEVLERVTANGEVLKELEPQEIDKVRHLLEPHQIESIAVCLLFSFSHPSHEQQIAAALRQEGYFVSASSEILPEYREFERTSTTVINAYVSPVLSRYLAKLEGEVQAGSQDQPFQVMQSNGGVISIQEAQKSGVRCILSGPAGGVIGSQFTGRSAFGKNEHLRLITFDMGGTSTDVALIDQEPTITTESKIAGFPIGIPVLDIHTIGSGGGSIAHVDPGGALRVGPQSAGANPGPACYGRIDPAHEPESIVPTVTDANLFLGRILAENFLGGKMPLRSDRAEFAIQKLSKEAGISPIETALGIVAVVNTLMERAVRVISVERGHDPREFTLLSFGGAGGLHAVDLAHKLAIPRVLIPPHASTLSALGMLAADLVKNYSKTVMLTASVSGDQLIQYLTPLITQARDELRSERIPEERINLEPSLDMRYLGQSYELSVPFVEGKDPIPDFHQAHQKAYGYQRKAAAADQIEIVNIRLRASGYVPKPDLPFFQESGPDPSPAFLEKRKVILETGGSSWLPFYSSEALQPGNQMIGPAVIVRSDTTIFLGHDDKVIVDPYQNLIVTIGPHSPGTGMTPTRPD